MILSPEQGRVLGALVEKELTTPQGYPLTDNALLAACNQTTSRHPVVSYDVGVLRTAVRDLREQGLLRTVHRPGERSQKHQHELPSALEVSPEQVAVLAVLLLRGPQTAAELRARAERMHPFDSTDQVEQVLAELSGRSEPLAQRLERQPGRKEPRWVQLLAPGPGPREEPAAVPAQVVRELLEALDAAAGDVQAALACFTPDAVLLTTQENPVGQDELAAFLARSPGLGWAGDLTVGEHDDVVWFLLVGAELRVSGVLVPHSGRYRLAQLHVGDAPAG